MKIKTLQAYILKEFMELYRTKIIVMVYLLPVMTVLLFGYGIKMDVTQARILILDNDQSKLSRKVTTAFEHTKYFNSNTTYMSEKEALKTIQQAKTDVILIIPSSFEKNLYKGLTTELGVFIDAAFPTRASTLEAYVQGEILNVATSVTKNMPGQAKGTIELNSRSFFNQAMRDEDAIVPGLIGLVLLVTPAILSALLIVKEKEKGTIFNFYASPLSKGEFLLAKMLPVFVLHSLNIIILFLIAIYIFEVPFRGSFFLYWFSSELYIMISLSIGMLISVITKKQIVAVVLTVIVTILPGFLYSGILMPISSMSGLSFIEAHIFPVMYYNHILYDAFLIGQGISSDEIILYLFILLGYLVFFFTSGVFLLKKELK